MANLCEYACVYLCIYAYVCMEMGVCICDAHAGVRLCAYVCMRVDRTKLYARGRRQSMYHAHA